MSLSFHKHAWRLAVGAADGKVTVVDLNKLKNVKMIPVRGVSKQEPVGAVLTLDDGSVAVGE